MVIQEPSEKDNFKKGDSIRINSPFRKGKHGKEGEIVAMAANGALIRFEDGSGTMVRYVHLIKI